MHFFSLAKEFFPKLSLFPNGAFPSDSGSILPKSDYLISVPFIRDFCSALLIGTTIMRGIN
ncbi:MAG TPA: hypothetical protein DCX89_02355 [Saprospirales bacterium]|nr:hypothetical protein [Saprospirales bacterium]HAY70711.1 hypothetical protein [Saprospirales bacterium]